MVVIVALQHIGPVFIVRLDTGNNTSHYSNLLIKEFVQHPFTGV